MLYMLSKGNASEDIHLHLGHQRHTPREEGEGEGKPIMIGQSTIKIEMGE